MAPLNDLLDRLPVSRGFLLVLAIIALVVYQANKPIRDSERIIARYESEIDARKARVSQSIELLEIFDEGLLRCIRKAAADRAGIHPESSGGIDDIRELELLYCRGSQISSLAGIGQLVGLKFLDISKNRIRSLAPLQNHPALRTLHAADNPLRNVEIVSSLPSLREFYMPDLPDVSCEDIEKLVEGLKSNFKSIRCAGKPGSEKAQATGLDSLARPAASSSINSRRLTPAEQRELLDYERDKRYSD